MVAEKIYLEVCQIIKKKILTVFQILDAIDGFIRI